MIDFRYHLISIVAVLLALSVGIVMGTGVLGGPALEILNDKVDSVSQRNDELNAEIDELTERIRSQEEFAKGAGPYLTLGALEGAQVVVIQMDGTGGGLIDEARAEIEQAGAQIPSVIKIDRKFELDDQLAVDELALAIGASTSDPAQLRQEAAKAIGTRAADAEAQGGAAVARFETLMQSLENGGFTSMNNETEGIVIPQGSAFLLLGGSEDPFPYEPAPFIATLATSLAADGAAVLVAETSQSSLELVPEVVNDPAGDSVATVGGGDRVEGRIAIVLGLRDALAGDPGHYGSGQGAEDPIPPHPSS